MLFLFILIVTATVMDHYGIKQADNMITFALGVLARGMGSEEKK